MATSVKKQSRPQHSRRKRNYTEKDNHVSLLVEQVQWQCQVCHQNYEQSISYCLSCYQALYYYCYVNAELFVEKDLAYLGIYYQTNPPSEGESEQELEEEEVPHPDLNWIDTLLA